MTSTYVFVHGAFCNSAVWAPIARELALRGHRTVAIDLPGHGLGARIPVGYLGAQNLDALATAPSGMAGISTADDVAAVSEVVRRAAELGSVILVGTSRGGLTLTAVGNVIPDLIGRIVYISAWCCVDATASEYAQAPELASSMLPQAGVIAVGNPAEIGAIRLNWRTSDPDHLAVLQAALLADGTRDELLAYLHTQEPDEALVVDEAATQADAASWGRIPRTYIRLTEDRAMPLPLQDRFIVEADAMTPDNPFDVHSVASSHLGWQLHPAQVVAILDKLASLTIRSS